MSGPQSRISANAPFKLYLQEKEKSSNFQDLHERRSYGFKRKRLKSSLRHEPAQLYCMSESGITKLISNLTPENASTASLTTQTPMQSNKS